MIADIVVGTLIVGYGAYVVYRHRKGGPGSGCSGCSSCGGGCTGCGHAPSIPESRVGKKGN